MTDFKTPTGDEKSTSVLWSSPLDGPEAVGKIHAGHLGKLGYREVIRVNVNRKWTTDDKKEWWYSKFTMSRRRKLIKLHRKQKGLCVFCQCQTWILEEGTHKGKPRVVPAGFTYQQMATADHIIPQSHGGTDRMVNLAMACTFCNNKRGVMPFEQFLEIRRDPEKWKAHNKKHALKIQQNSQKRKKLSEERLQLRIWRMALVFLMFPEYFKEFKESCKK